MARDTTEHPDCADVGATTEAHERLKTFAGVFNAKVTMWMGPGEPMVSTGVMTNTIELGGRFLHHHYKGDPGPGPFPNFEGRGYWGYNTIDKRYEGFWIDTACTAFQVEHGQMDASGKAWTMHSSMTDPRGGKPLRKRSVITLKDDDHHSMEMHFQGPDGDWQKGMRIEYTRA